MTTLADLIGRVERATGPDREIDAAIFEISGLVNESHCTMWCSQDGRTDLTRERYIRAWAPDFTRSIDAALHLVPENTEITITSLMWRPGRAVANLRTGSVIDPATREWSSTAATMPLALVAASLKARSA